MAILESRTFCRSKITQTKTNYFVHLEQGSQTPVPPGGNFINPLLQEINILVQSDCHKSCNSVSQTELRPTLLAQRACSYTQLFLSYDLNCMPVKWRKSTSAKSKAKAKSSKSAIYRKITMHFYPLLRPTSFFGPNLVLV